MPTETQCPSCDTRLKVPVEQHRAECPLPALPGDLHGERLRPGGRAGRQTRGESPALVVLVPQGERQADDPDRDEDEAPRRSRRQEEEYSDAPTRSRRRADDDDEEYDRPSCSRRDEDEDEPAARKPRCRCHDPKAAARRIAEAEARAGVPNPFAYTALGLGIGALPLAICCGFFGVPVGVVAVAFGIFALQKPYGRGFAWAGIACGGVSIILCLRRSRPRPDARTGPVAGPARRPPSRASKLPQEPQVVRPELADVVDARASASCIRCGPMPKAKPVYFAGS